MKFKSIPARSWRRSRNPPTPVVTLLQDGADEEFGPESDELNVSSDPQCENGDTDVEIVPDSFEERNVPMKKSNAFGTSDNDKGPFSLNLDACIVCGIIDGFVCLCSGIDCPVAFHWKCVNDEPGNEDAESSYCAYCWFKMQVSRTKALREKAIAAEKALFNYLDKEVNGGGKKGDAIPKAQEKKTDLSDGENANQEHSEGCVDVVSDQRLHLENDVYTSGEGQAQMGKDKDKARDECMQLNENIEQSVDCDGQLKEDTNQSKNQCKQFGKSVNQSEDQQQVEMNEEKASDGLEAAETEERPETENFQDAVDGKDEETDKGRRKSDARTEKVVDGSPFVFIQESIPRNGSDQGQLNKRRRRQVKYTEFDSDVSSNESTNERNGQDVTEQRSSSFIWPSPAGKKNQKRKFKAAKVGQQKRETSAIRNEKRKRMLWTPEEESMLTEGVEAHLGDIHKNIPWRKILEMGAKVFHETRTPTDLKDKWRAMNAKKVEHS